MEENTKISDALKESALEWVKECKERENGIRITVPSNCKNEKDNMEEKVKALFPEITFTLEFHALRTDKVAIQAIGSQFEKGSLYMNAIKELEKDFNNNDCLM